MATVGRDLEKVRVGDRELWLDGPPHALFKQMRSECPVHWSERISEYPEEDGFWSVTTAEEMLRILIEETLARYPHMQLEGEPVYVESPFVNQLKTMPVLLAP